jgi:hypothetical protein
VNNEMDQTPAFDDAAADGAEMPEHPAGSMTLSTRSRVGARARALAGSAYGIGLVASIGMYDTTISEQFL